MPNCNSCNKSLDFDEIAIYKKLVNRGAEKFLCTRCLAEYFKVDETLIFEKIHYFKQSGCTLFEK